ncbi:hypothetical protein [Teredinibacter sp. KSP-S5-2]|uniref:hypothetical protein n=1 Tax=Teredinibacter sp. KSP-S5-2 TaxID=3034506 RepID=UPI002934C089|nr:hypothetical protein [Teredinibacter sp. KSP-S5-2]WNO08950.1 general secretion pathway protein GspF [Teredinibacter sp. KSP-S5-2]
MSKRKPFFHPDEPLLHSDHRRPKTRREFLSQGFSAGMGAVYGTSVMGSLLASRVANAQIAYPTDLQTRINECGIPEGAGKIPFICFDLAGGANIAGSNVLVGGPGGQKDFLSSEGYGKQGLPPAMVPGLANPDSANNEFFDETLGLAFHSDSQFLRGILERTSAATQAAIDGAVFAARSENDTGNNPHNPMYAINIAGANGELLALIGSRTSDSGGNSMAPADMINSEVRPTKIDRPADVTGLVNVGDFGSLTPAQVVDIMLSVEKISGHKMDLASITTGTSDEALIKEKVKCAYVKSAKLAADVPDSSSLSPESDPDIVGGASSIFTAEEFNNDREFRKTASVMKMVIDGNAGAGTIAMGGYDYHTGDRATGELRDLRAGRCMGACLEYAARRGKPLMLYVFSDGSVFSNGMTDESVNGRGKGVWTGDNQQTAASFFLVYNPGGRATLMRPEDRQIGYMRRSGDVETSSSPVANNVNQLVQAVMLNYMALHGEQAQFDSVLANRGLTHGLGSVATRDSLTAFTQLSSVQGGIVVST